MTHTGWAFTVCVSLLFEVQQLIYLPYISRVLIFCQWKKMLDIIERFTGKRTRRPLISFKETEFSHYVVELQGWKFGRLDGNTNVASRQRLVDTFNSDDSYFGMLCTTRTGGVGLNLVGADRVILYE
jgi:DNA excision repair protein ERCC-6